MTTNHIKQFEEKGEKKVLNDIIGSVKIGSNKEYRDFCESFPVDDGCSHLNGIGKPDICFEYENKAICFEVKSGSGNKKDGHINLNQLRLHEGVPVVLECSLSPVYNVDYCVFPANFLVRVALCGHDDYKIRPLHQSDIMASAGFSPNPIKASRDFGCSVSELKDKIIEAQKLYNEDTEVQKIVEIARKRLILASEENKKLGELLEGKK